MVDVELDLRQPTQHLVGVSLRCQPQRSRLLLQLPSWTPGSYLIRDYVRQLQQLELTQNAKPLQAQRLGPACWQVDVDPTAGPLLIRYQVMATELSVRTCHLDQDHAFLALAAVVMDLEGERWSPHRLRCHLPDGWQAFVPLPSAPETDGGWWAANLDQLLDSPVEAGPHRSHAFQVCGVEHRWVTWGGPSGADAWLLDRYPTLLSDVERVCEACCRLMGQSQPASQHYLFVLHLLDEGFGGLEHDDASVLVFGRRELLKPDGYRKFLQLVAHEYLHQWNVRRLRPKELSPIDYHRPTVVPTLWFAEGVTSYFDQFLPFAAGLCTEEQLIDDLGTDLSRYLLTPGRRVQSLRLSSQEAWVKLYKPDAYSPDSQVSYYLKGAVVALCLDLHLRRHASSLAAVLQQLWQRFGRWRRGYGEQDLISELIAAAPDLPGSLDAWLNGSDDPDLHGYLADVGLTLEEENSEQPWSGLTLRRQGGLLMVQRVFRDGPAERAGVMVADELIGVDGERVRSEDQWQAALAESRLQRLLVARRGQLREFNLQCAPPQVKRFRLTSGANLPPAVQAHRQAWMRLQPC